LTPAQGLTVNLIVSVLIGYPYIFGLMLTVTKYRWLQKICKDELKKLEDKYEDKPKEQRDLESY
jgi:hypothetical protein